MSNSTTPTVESILIDHLQQHQIDLEELASQSLDAAYFGSFAVLQQDHVAPLDAAGLLHYLHQTAVLFITLKDEIGEALELQ